MYEFADDFDMVRGAHQITFGLDYLHQSDACLQHAVFQRAVLVRRQRARVCHSRTSCGRDASGKSSRVPTSTSTSATSVVATYVQDAWKASSKLTINYGLRWEPYSPSNDDNQRVDLRPGALRAEPPAAKVYVNAPAGLIFPGDDGYPGHASSNGNMKSSVRVSASSTIRAARDAR